MAIGLVNIDLLDLRTEINVVTYDFPEICASNDRNKWGIHRTYGSGATAQIRANTMASDPDLTYWKGYDHNTDNPGISTLINPVDKDGSTEGISYSSLGTYTLERWESSDGTTWTEINNNETSWFRLTLGSANHTVDTDANSGTVTGATPISSLHSASASVDVPIDANPGDERYGRIILDHPDSSDSDAYTHTVTFTQSAAAAPGQISVTPSSISAPKAGGSYNVTVEATASWTSSSIESAASLDWSPKSGSTGTTGVSVTVGENESEFEALKNISFATGNNTATLTITQD